MEFFKIIIIVIISILKQIRLIFLYSGIFHQYRFQTHIYVSWTLIWKMKITKTNILTTDE